MYACLQRGSLLVENAGADEHDGPAEVWSQKGDVDRRSSTRVYIYVSRAPYASQERPYAILQRRDMVKDQA
jgi:hypothetical protein